MALAPTPGDAAPAGVPDLPIHELLALEAVDRLGSVQGAAEALHVTSSGISHRLASLERRIGSPLLRRQGRGVVLTEVARRYVATVRPGLAALASATEDLLEAEHRCVRIATAAAVGVAWLLPRLQRYAQRQPESRFELLTVSTTDELPPDRWDLLIHYGRPPRRDARRAVLFAEQLVPVCAPAWLAPRADGEGPPLLRLTQLDVPGSAGKHRGGRAAPHAQLVFDDALAMLEAAAAGAGLAWSTLTAARPYLAQGRLVRAGDEVREGLRYTAELSEAGRLKPLAAACYAGLLEDAQAG